ncbi:unnamed protein product [Orchesella dallaii]|uniref:HTH CENPB-type domain-containing protein n=1 Tax=Orchesella dallaii TaxID=48710 RepID=A0ABP1PK12_9HEXA
MSESSIIDSLEPPSEIIGDDGLIHTFIKVSHSDEEVDENDHDGINLDEDDFAMALGHLDEEQEVEEDGDDEDQDATFTLPTSSSEDSSEEEEDDKDGDLSSDEKMIVPRKKRKVVESSGNRSRQQPKTICIDYKPKPTKSSTKSNSRRSEKSDDDMSEEDDKIVLPQKGPNNLYDVNFKLQVLKYFETHSAKRTSAKFGVPPKRVREWKSCEEKIQDESLGVRIRRPRGDNYTIEEKLQAIAFSEQHSIHEAQLLYNVHKRTIEKWKQTKAQMEAIIHEGLGSRKRRGGGGRKPQYTHIENDLRDWVIALRLQGVTVNYRMILNKARTLLGKDASSQDLPAPSTITWVVNFLSRQNLFGQLGTTLGEEDPYKLLTQITGNNDQTNSNISAGNLDLLGHVEIPENPNQRNRRTITLDDKVSIIERIQRGETQSTVARALKVAQSTIQTIWTSRNQILERFQDPQRKTRIVHWKKYSDINEALHNWYTDNVSKNIQMDGQSLMDKAIQLCEVFNKPEFKSQVSKWTEVFCRKHGIHNIVISAEPLSSVSITPIAQKQETSITEVLSPIKTQTNERDDYSDFFLSSVPPSVSSGETYESDQQQDTAMQSNFQLHPSNFIPNLPPQPPSNFSNDSTVRNNTHMSSAQISTTDALKYIGFLRSWVCSNYGTNEVSLNNHLNALENVALKRQISEIAPLSKKTQFGK